MQQLASRVFTLGGLACVALIGCVSASSDVAPRPAGEARGAPAPRLADEGERLPGAQAAPESPAEASPEPAPKPKERSKIPAHARHVHPKSQPGLAEFADALPRGGALWIGPLAGNGGRDVLVYIPPKADDDADLRIVVHFHGTHSQHIERKAPGVPKKKWVGWNRLEQTLQAAEELHRERPYNVALVYPISAGKRPEPTHTGWFNKDYDRIWMAASDAPGYTDDFEVLHAEIRDVLTQKLGVHETRLPDRVLCEGHSAGGMPLLHIAASGSRHVEEYLFQDASFQGWGDGCWNAVQASGTGAMVTMVITDRGIADPFGKRDPWCTRLEENAAFFAEHERECAAGPKTRPSGSKLDCETLQAEATEWTDYEAWCTGMKNEMRDVAGARVLRTKISHGDQPRHFTGGLELPDDF